MLLKIQVPGALLVKKMLLRPGSERIYVTITSTSFHSHLRIRYACTLFTPILPSLRALLPQSLLCISFHFLHVRPSTSSKANPMLTGDAWKRYHYYDYDYHHTLNLDSPFRGRHAINEAKLYPSVTNPSRYPSPEPKQEEQ